MQWRDPVTGRKKTKSTGIERTGRAKDRKEAERVAAKFEAVLREGRYHEPSKVTWAEFRERYETEVLASLAQNTAVKAWSVFNSVEAILNPLRLRDLTEKRLSHYQATLRSNGRAESTIKGYLAHLKAGLRWAEKMGLLPKSPRIQMPKRAKSAKGSDPMKGRPITGEEFERMLAKTEPAVRNPAADPRTRASRRIARRAEMAGKVSPTWQHYLRGLWLSGLRITESLDLSWDTDAPFQVDLSGKYPILRIPAEVEKGHKDRLLPITPDFAEFLDETPAEERTGKVFNPLSPSNGEAGQPRSRDTDSCSKRRGRWREGPHRR